MSYFKDVYENAHKHSYKGKFLEAVAFVFYKDGKYLIEHRPNNDVFFPSGKIDKTDVEKGKKTQEDYKILALKREVNEEFNGKITFDKQIFLGEVKVDKIGIIFSAYLITDFKGEMPEYTLEEGENFSKLEWISPSKKNQYFKFDSAFKISDMAETALQKNEKITLAKHSSMFGKTKKDVSKDKNFEGIRTIFVYSGKGGVGKTTVCVNLAYTYAQLGYKVALMDGDISGPSVPVMVKNIPDSTMPELSGFMVKPGNFGGVLVNSSGFICDPKQDSFWSDHYLKGAFYQLLHANDWSDIDILLVDLPPGTNAIHQELFSKTKGVCLIVTTPQMLSHTDTIKSINFMHRLEVNTIGYVENMSYYPHICEHCSQPSRVQIFNYSEKSDLKTGIRIKCLAQLPIIPEVNKSANEGIPYVYRNPKTEMTKHYKKLAEDILENYTLCEQQKDNLVLYTT